MDFIKKNKTWIGIGSCILAIIGNFLPFFNITLLGSKQNGVSFLDGDGKIVVVAFAIACVLIYLKKNFKIILGVLAIGIGITIYDGLNVAKVAVDSYYGSINLAIGFYLIVIGGLLAFIIQFIKGEENIAVSNISEQGFVSYNTQNVQQNTFNNQPVNNMYSQQQYNNQPMQQQGFSNQYAQPMNQQQYNNPQQVNQGFQQSQYGNQQMNQGYQQQYNNQNMNQAGQNQYPNQNQYPYQ